LPKWRVVMEVRLAGEESRPLVCTRSPHIRDRIRRLMAALDSEIISTSDGIDVLQRYIKNHPQLIIIDHDLPKLGSVELLNRLAKINVSKRQQMRVLVICSDNSRDTILKIMKPVKSAKGTLRLSMLVTPWNVPDFYRQIINLYPEDLAIKSRIEKTLTEFRNREIESLNETRLFLGVSETGLGLRVEVGDDKVISSTSVTMDDYAKKIERALLATTVEYIQFSLSSTADQLPANVVALMMLINGFATKHKKEILFVNIPENVKKQIEDFNLTGILPLEKEVQLF